MPSSSQPNRPGGDLDKEPDRTVEHFLLALLIGLGSWLGGKTGETIWDAGRKVVRKTSDREN